MQRFNQTPERNGIRATMIPAKGSIAEVDIVETVVERKEMKNLEKALGEFDPNLFYIVEDLRSKTEWHFQ